MNWTNVAGTNYTSIFWNWTNLIQSFECVLRKYMFKEHRTHSCYITFVVFCVFFYFIILSEGQMTENKTIIYTLLMCMPGLPAYSFGGATFSIRTKTTSVYMREGEMGKIQTKKFLFRSLGLSKMVDVVHIRCERQRSFLWETQTYPLSSSYLLYCHLHAMQLYSIQWCHRYNFY